MIKSLLLSLGVLVSVFSFSQINSGNPSVPFGSNATYDHGMLPTNLPIGGMYGASTEAGEAYDEFIETYLVDCENGTARVEFDNPRETVSEGIAYTMLLASYAADQNTFNKLWKYYKTYRNGNGVMNWKTKDCNNVIGFNGATDAEVDAAMALIIADKQWGSDGQAHNYKADALSLIQIIRDFEVNQSNKTFENGDVWKPGDCRNPSYQAPAYARVWAQFLSENGRSGASFWRDVANATEKLHRDNSGQTSSGLASNWSLVNGQPSGACNGSGTSAFSFGYDACRAPWRQGVDFLWHGNTANGMQGIINTQTNFWIGRGGAPEVIGGNNFSQAGSGNGDRNGAFLGMIGAQSMASSTSIEHQSFINAMYNENKNVTEDRYFSQVLRCLGLFVQTGNFWNPFSSTIDSDNITPTASITSPVNGLSTCLGVPYTITADANDEDGRITKVEFFDGNDLLFTDTDFPYSYEVAAPTAGAKIYLVKAYDNGGKLITSSPVNVAVSSAQSSNGENCEGIIVSDDFHGAIDDFDSEELVTLGNLGNFGVYWFSDTLDPDNTYSYERTTSNMTVTLDKASPKFKVFGLTFSQDKSRYLNLNDFSNADIKLDVTNNTNADVYIEIQLRDINGNTAEIFNADENDISWANKWQKIGTEIKQGRRFNGTLDLSSFPDKLGGLHAVSWDCGTPLVCPETDYQLNASRIVEIIFLVNGGAGTTEGNTLYPEATGDLVFNYFSIGEVSNPESNVIKTGVAPPASDVDGDEVDDDLDLCPNTISGQTVDADGCAASQRDTDNDGVNDSGDQCPNTPEGASIDANGCAASERDTDNDNVTDDKDVCPNTPAGAAVDETGCLITGTNEAEQLGIRIFPNPATNFIYVEQNNFIVNRVSVTDLRGIQVLTSSLTSGQEFIDLSSLKSGVYTIMLSGNNNLVQENIVIK